MSFFDDVAAHLGKDKLRNPMSKHEGYSLFSTVKEALDAANKRLNALDGKGNLLAEGSPEAKPRVRVPADGKAMVWGDGAIYDLMPDGKTYRLRRAP